MKSYRKDGWIITTPVFVGNDEGMGKAALCTHESWSERPVETPRGVIYFDTCDGCGSNRCRQKVPDDQN